MAPPESPRLLWRQKRTFQSSRHPYENPKNQLNHAVDVVGLGLWAKADGQELQRLFHPQHSLGLNPFSLRKKRQTRRPTGIQLINLGETFTDEPGTIRVERQYRRDPSSPHGLVLDQRLDFEILERPVSYKGSLAKLFNGEGRGPFTHVVVKDLCKGTVTEDLIDNLLTVNSGSLFTAKTQWFISSKNPEPEWLPMLIARLNEPSQIEAGSSSMVNRGSIRLLYLPAKAVRLSWERGQEDAAPPFRWFLAGRHPSDEPIKWLEKRWKQIGDVRHTSCIVVATPRGLEMLALYGDNTNLSVYWQPNELMDTEPHDLSGRASAYFASLISACINEEKGFTNPEDVFHDAIDDSAEYIRRQVDRLRRGGLVDKSGGPVVVGGRDIPEPHIDKCNVRDLAALKTEWKEALPEDDLPLVTIESEEVLQVWRGSRDIHGFVEVVDSRRRGANQLTRFLERYSRLSNVAQVSTFIQARPGSGKTFLVKRLVDTLPLELHEINIARRGSRDEILAAFDEVSSFQARRRDCRLVVFVDEINARASGSNVYDMFLSVLDERTYLRNGTTFQLAPCAWIFAGTEYLWTIEEWDRLREAFRRATTGGGAGSTRVADGLNGEPTLLEALPNDPDRLDALLKHYGSDEARARYVASKAPDFVSRLTLRRVVLNPELDANSLKQERTNRVYLGAVQLIKRFPGLKQVQRSVLMAFADLKNISKRELGHAVNELRGPKFDRIGWDSVPQDSILRNAFKAGGEGWVSIEE